MWNRFRTVRINCMHVEWIKHRLKGSSIGHIDRFQVALIKSGLTTVELIIYRPNSSKTGKFNQIQVRSIKYRVNRSYIGQIDQTQKEWIKSMLFWSHTC